MRLLVDTHVMLWYLEDNSRLPLAWSDVLEDSSNEIHFSIASLWEIAIKTNTGKLIIEYPLDQFIPAKFPIFPISVLHLLAYQKLPSYHRDPFDRILIAQAQTDGLTIMTKDPNFPLYDLPLLD